MIDAMNSSTNSTIHLNMAFSDNVTSKEYSDIKVAVVCVIIILNVIMNSLVIAVIARYPQLREDRTTLFMFSLSVSDLAAGCTFMPISAALCSRATPEVADMVSLLPKIHAFTMWWFGSNSMHSLCWLTLSKMVVILKPLRVEQLLTHKRCYIFIGVNWIIGGLLAVVNFKVNITWNTMLCTYRLPNDNSVKAGYMTFFVVGVLLPILLIVYGTIRIVIVVVRTHRQISALEHSVGGGNSSIGNTGFVTAQAIRSSKNIIIICVVSLLLNTPVLTYAARRSGTSASVSGMLNFACVWLYEANTFVNSLLYLVLFRSVRQKVVQMIYAILKCIRS